jgi:hypothetical protein
MTTSQWKRDHGSRSRRAGTFVSTMPVWTELTARRYPRARRVIFFGNVVLACRVFGHRFRFAAEGPTMRWTCARCGTVGGEKTYASGGEAARYARAFDREDRDDLGRRAPLVAGLPLRVMRVMRRRRGV